MGQEESIEMRAGRGGKSAYVKGTRTRVSDVVRLYDIMQEQLVIERICLALPHLNEDQVRAALEYGRRDPGVNDEIRQERALLETIPTG